MKLTFRANPIGRDNVRLRTFEDELNVINFGIKPMFGYLTTDNKTDSLRDV
jgi:hypothetical protein